MARWNPYPTRSTEPDMRQELINTLDGTYPEIAKKRQVFLRKMRRPLATCPCVDEVTKEPDLDTYCPVCLGEGYLWDETLIDTYKVYLKSDVGNSLLDSLRSPGNIAPPLSSFFLEYDVDITKEDSIVELALTTAGALVTPYRRTAIWKVGLPIDFRSDNGKLEYWKVDCYLKETKFLNGADGG